MSVNRKYWIRAKRYGWGWGLPLRWQGWVAMAIFFTLLLLGAVFLLPVQGPTIFIAYVTALIAISIAVCWVTGEPPRWRWGDK